MEDENSVLKRCGGSKGSVRSSPARFSAVYSILLFTAKHFTGIITHICDETFTKQLCIREVPVRTYVPKIICFTNYPSTSNEYHSKGPKTLQTIPVGNFGTFEVPCWVNYRSNWVMTLFKFWMNGLKFYTYYSNLWGRCLTEEHKSAFILL